MSIQYQANAVFNALEEGVVYYLVWEAESQGTENIEEQVRGKLLAYGWTPDTINYWLKDWLNL